MAKKAVKKKVLSKKVNAPKRSNFIIGASRAWKGFFFFLILFLVSVFAYNIVAIEMYQELFFLLAYGFGAITLALLIALLAYFFYNKFKIRK